MIRPTLDGFDAVVGWFGSLDVGDLQDADRSRLTDAAP